MDTFPAIPLPSACPMGVKDPLIEDDYMSGDDAARPQVSRPRMQPVQVEWDAMTKAHLAVLRAFRAAHRATLFLWTDPFTGEVYETRFAGESPLAWKPLPKYPGRAKVVVNLLPVRPYEV